MMVFHRLKQTFINSKFAQNVSILAAGTAISHVFVFLTTPILTRLYTPEEFGFLSVYLSILYTLATIASLLYEQAIPLPENEEEAVHLFFLSIIIVIFISAIVFIGGGLLPVNKWFAMMGLKENIWLLAFSLFGIGWFQVFNSWAIRTEEYKVISRSKVSMNTGQMVSQILLGLFRTGYLGLLIGEVLGRISGVIAFYTALKNKKMPSIKMVTIKGLKNMIVRYKKFPLISSWSAVINSIGVQLPTFFLAAIYGAETAGFYLLAQKILTLPEGLLGYSVSQVYLSEAAQAYRFSPRQMIDLFRQTLKKMMVISFIVIGLIALIGPFFISLIFGKDWGEAGEYLLLISVLYFFRMVVKPITANFYILECQHLEMISETIRIFLIVLSMVISYLFIEEATGAILCISLMTSFGYLVCGFFTWIAMKSSLNTKKIERNTSIKK